MTGRILTHVRGNAVAYVALFFAIGGGGGAAIAATVSASSNTVHACVSKKTGAVFVARKCSRGSRALTFNKQGPRGATGKAGAPGAAGAPGTPAVVAYGDVADNGVAGDQQGLTITQTSTGHYAVTVTADECAQQTVVPVASPVGGPVSSGPIAGIPEVVIGAGAGDDFTVTAGDVQGGSFVATDQGFDLVVECGH